MKVRHINLVAPVYATNSMGTEGRLVNWLDSEEGRKLGIEYRVTDLRQFPQDVNKLKYDFYDATIVFKGEMLTPEILKDCTRPLVLYFPDDILVYPIYAKLIKLIGHCFDIVYTFDKKAIPSFYDLGCKNVKWLPSWTGSDLFFDKGLERDIDICFVGSFNKRRIEMMNAVKSHFKDKKLYFNQGVFGQGYVDILNRSKIVINVGQSMSSGTSQRVFEASACGAMVLTNYNDEIYDLFTSAEIQTWTDLQQLLDILEICLGDDSWRFNIAQAGYERTMKDHLAQHRFKQIISDIEKL